jgi:hypothetical protein
MYSRAVPPAANAALTAACTLVCVTPWTPTVAPTTKSGCPRRAGIRSGCQGSATGAVYSPEKSRYFASV